MNKFEFNETKELYKNVIKNGKYIKLNRYNDKKGLNIPRKYKFLKKYSGNDILQFKNNYIIIIFIKNNKDIHNYIIYKNTKQYVKSKMNYKDFKRIILNEDYKGFNNIFNFSKLCLYSYELNLLNDVNDWLNNYIMKERRYYLLYNL